MKINYEELASKISLLSNTSTKDQNVHVAERSIFFEDGRAVSTDFRMITQLDLDLGFNGGISTQALLKAIDAMKGSDVVDIKKTKKGGVSFKSDKTNSKFTAQLINDDDAAIWSFVDDVDYDSIDEIELEKGVVEGLKYSLVSCPKDSDPMAMGKHCGVQVQSDGTNIYLSSTDAELATVTVAPSPEGKELENIVLPQTLVKTILKVWESYPTLTGKLSLIHDDIIELNFDDGDITIEGGLLVSQDFDIVKTHNTIINESWSLEFKSDEEFTRAVRQAYKVLGKNSTVLIECSDGEITFKGSNENEGFEFETKIELDDKVNAGIYVDTEKLNSLVGESMEIGIGRLLKASNSKHGAYYYNYLSEKEI